MQLEIKPGTKKKFVRNKAIPSRAREPAALAIYAPLSHFRKNLVSAQTQLRFNSQQQRAFGISNIFYFNYRWLWHWKSHCSHTENLHRNHSENHTDLFFFCYSRTLKLDSSKLIEKKNQYYSFLLFPRFPLLLWIFIVIFSVIVLLWHFVYSIFVFEVKYYSPTYALCFISKLQCNCLTQWYVIVYK